jgi:hypothetical protein
VVVPAVISRRLADVPDVLSVVEIGSDAVEAGRPAIAPPKPLWRMRQLRTKTGQARSDVKRVT